MKSDRPSTALSADEAFNKLKSILLEPDQQRISQLEEELSKLRGDFENKEKLLESLKPIIGQVLSDQIARSREEMARILAPVIGAAIKKQITEAKDEVVDALYPVIGATIRKSVSEAMKNLARMVNEKVDRALSFRLLFHKAKARISGVPEAELLLKETLPFNIHEIFFIHRDTGLLIEHVSGSRPLSTDDQDIIASMLTAIRDFAANAFKSGEEEEVNEIQYNDFQIILESGRRFYLAVVVSGVADKRFYTLLNEITQKIHKQFGRVLREFDGNTTSLAGAAPLLQKMITVFDRPVQNEEESKPRGLLYLAIAAVLAVVLYFGLFYTPSPPAVKTSAAQKTAVLPRVDFQKFVMAVNQKAGTAFTRQNAPFRLVYEDGFLIIRGTVGSETIRRQVGAVAAEITAYPVIINELVLEDRSKLKEALRKKIESSVLFFPPGKMILNDRHKSVLDSVAAWFKQASFKQMYIIGHSDNTGSEPTNKRISLERARKVYDYLLSKKINAQQLKIMALGSVKPIADNTSKEGRAKNRRVELRLEE